MKKSEIKNSTELFLYKATVDFNAAKILLDLFEKDNKELDLEKINFELQQAVEKALKSILSFYKIKVPKTHQIQELIQLSKQNNIKLIENIDILTNLSDFAVEGRYAIICDDIEDTYEYIKITKKLLTFIKEQIKCDT